MKSAAHRRDGQVVAVPFGIFSSGAVFIEGVIDEREQARQDAEPG